MISIFTDIVSYVIGAILLIVFLPQRLILSFDDTLYFLLKSIKFNNLRKISADGNLGSQASNFKAIFEKANIINEVGHKKSWKQFRDEWSDIKTDYDKAEYYICASLKKDCVNMNHRHAKMDPSGQGLGREIDIQWINDYGETVSLEVKWGYPDKELETSIKDDVFKSKNGVPISSGGNKLDYMELCKDFDRELCAHALLSSNSPDYNKGLTLEQINQLDSGTFRPEGKSGAMTLEDAYRRADNIKDPNKPGINILSIKNVEKFQPCRLNDYCKKLVEKYYKPEYMENGYDYIDSIKDYSTPTLDRLLGVSEGITAMSGEISFVEDNNETERNFILAIFIGISAIFSTLGAGLYYKKKRRLLSKT